MIVLEMKNSIHADLGLKAAIATASVDDAAQTLTTLKQLRADDEEREQRLDEIFNRLEALMRRFAGEASG